MLLKNGFFPTLKKWWFWKWKLVQIFEMAFIILRILIFFTKQILTIFIIENFDTESWVTSIKPIFLESKYIPIYLLSRALSTAMALYYLIIPYEQWFFLRSNQLCWDYPVFPMWCGFFNKQIYSYENNNTTLYNIIYTEGRRERTTSFLPNTPVTFSTTVAACTIYYLNENKKGFVRKSFSSIHSKLFLNPGHGNAPIDLNEYGLILLCTRSGGCGYCFHRKIFVICML